PRHAEAVRRAAGNGRGRVVGREVVVLRDRSLLDRRWLRARITHQLQSGVGGGGAGRIGQEMRIEPGRVAVVDGLIATGTTSGIRSIEQEERDSLRLSPIIFLGLPLPTVRRVDMAVPSRDEILYDRPERGDLLEGESEGLTKAVGLRQRALQRGRSLRKRLRA